MEVNIPRPLLDEIASGKCLPFIGAGFSMNAELSNGGTMPDWHSLCYSLAEIANISPKQKELNIASQFEKKFGRVQLIETIRRSLHADHATPGEAHKAFADLTFETVYTTNFDMLLEDAYSQSHKPYRSLVGGVSNTVPWWSI